MRSTLRILICLAAFLLVAGSMLAQGTTGSLNGTVTHENAPLPGVTISISSSALQGARVAVSNVNGDFNFPALPPGAYTISFEMEGMGTVTNTVRVGLARTERVNADLQLAALATEITVTAAAPAVLETTEIQANFENELVEDLPVARTLPGVVNLAPGVSNNGPDGSAGIVISGSYAYDSLFLVNGAVTNENLRGQTDDLYIEDAIQETSVITGSISAEYGRFTGGVVSAITKSGGNEFSGSFRDSLTNPSWSAASDAGEPKAESDMSEVYEMTLGGRVVRDRLWFFTAARYAERTWQEFYSNTTVAFNPSPGETDERYEIKLTGQLNPKHSLVGSYLSYEDDQQMDCPWGCFEITAIDTSRQLPREMVTANYNGILTSSFLVEAGYSTRDIRWTASGGDYQTTDFTDPRDMALGSLGYDWTYYGVWGTPWFCGVCDDETRENEYINLKATYYLATPSMGTHNIIAGYENFAESRFANNYQSGSGLNIYTYYIPPVHVGDPNQTGSLRPTITYGDVLYYFPVENLSVGSDFVTDSLFINDKWDLNNKWSFNIGIRYDKNDGKDSSLNTISKDSNISPRLGLIYDINGDGRLRVNASYSRYVSRIQESVGGAGGGGEASWYGYWYDGPDIGGPDSGMDSFDVMEQFFVWLLGKGWSHTNRTAPDTFFGASVPGLNQRFPGDMNSPAVDEITIGFGMQIGQKGFMRFDYVDKDWTDFYVTSTSPGDTVTAPQGTLDIVTYGNCSSCLTRTYQGLHLQGSYRATDRFNIGGNYTWSETKGNNVGEWAGGGPFGDNIYMYQEYQAYDQRRPEGVLPNDSTHKLRLWLGYDLPMGSFGNLNFSLLERFDTGTPYQAVATIDTGDYVACDPCGYENPDSTHAYYFSDRGAFRRDDVTATDLAVNYEVPIGRVNLFVQGEIINAFNEQAVVWGPTSIRLLEDFDPFTETPVEGTHWEKRSSFGQATDPDDYQLPRTYRISLGVRF